MVWFLVLGVFVVISVFLVGILRRMGSCFVSRIIGVCTEIFVIDAVWLLSV